MRFVYLAINAQACAAAARSVLPTPPRSIGRNGPWPLNSLLSGGGVARGSRGNGGAGLRRWRRSASWTGRERLEQLRGHFELLLEHLFQTTLEQPIRTSRVCVQSRPELIGDATGSDQARRRRREAAHRDSVAKESMVERSSINWRKEIATPNFRWNSVAACVSRSESSPISRKLVSAFDAVQARAGKFLHQGANKTREMFFARRAPATKVDCLAGNSAAAVGVAFSGSSWIGASDSTGARGHRLPGSNGRFGPDSACARTDK